LTAAKSSLPAIKKMTGPQPGSRFGFKHIGHLAPGVAGPVEVLARGTQDVVPRDAILVVEINVSSRRSPREVTW